MVSCFQLNSFVPYGNGYMTYSSMSSRLDFFIGRVSDYEKKIQTYKTKSAQVSWLRTFVFVLFIVLFILFLNLQQGWALTGLAVVFFICFGVLIKWHNRIKGDLDFFRFLESINRQEADRLNYKFDDIQGFSGFSDESHPYCVDIDLFGKSSIIQLINRAETRQGIDRVKTWLSGPASREVIQRRQSAVRELMPLIDWRQQVQARGRGKESDRETEHLFYDWLVGYDKISNNLLFRIAPVIAAAITLSVVTAISVGWLPFYSLLLPIIFCLGFIAKNQQYAVSTYQMTQSGVRLLKSIGAVLTLIENQKFQNSDLVRLQNHLVDEYHLSASQKIERLQRILDFFNSRGNQFYHLLNSFFLLDNLLLLKAERWRKQHRHDVAEWFDTIAETEALASIAAFAFANESYTFPEVSANDVEFVAEGMGHPLIPEDIRVYNDFKMSGRGSVSIITGSNMAGKSTFLRTVGVNVVLAFCGAPVCARTLRLSVFQLFTSMRTKDNLEEHVSSFYAELVRIRRLLDTINEERPVMFLLDEILKGTNSADRHTGAEALALQLSGLNAFGLISTHDLELGRLSSSHKNIANYNFSSEILGEEIVFDYKLRTGICQSTNASQLMAKMGIRLNLKP